MCGISGFVNVLKNFDEGQNISLLKKFCKILDHRGPDSNGIWYDFKSKVFLAHTRLSINDLTPAGSQPMINQKNNHIIVFNGEIYNHLDIRKKILKDHNIIWQGNSDTETLLKTIECLGIKKTLDNLEGMFSFCLFDKKNNKIYLVRDKYGEKPLYYGSVNQNFVFGSELKIFSHFPKFNKRISKNALNLFLKYSYIPEPYSIFEGVFKLNPGEYIELNLSELNFNNLNYFKSLKKVKWFNQVLEQKRLIKKNDAIIQLDRILNLSIKESLTSDVEVGSFLSGGIDSSIVSAIAQKNSNKKLKTFSICFKDEEYNEQKFSKLVADHIKSDHKEFTVNNQNIFDYYEKIPDIYDEPFADSSQIPTAILSKFASENVKVCLTGDGADEFYGGYNRYVFINKINSFSKYLPKLIRSNLSKLIISMNFSSLVNLSNFLNKVFFSKNFVQFDDKLQKFGRILNDSSDAIKMYSNIIETFSNHKNPIFQNIDENIIISKINLHNSETNHNLNDIEKIMKFDQDIYLTGDILHKVDRASMFYSLETRIPFLNSKVTQFASDLPYELKMSQSGGKYILKEIAKKYLPKQIISRKKMGFSVPLNNWIVKNSNEFITNIENKREIFSDLGFNHKNVISHFYDHKSQKKNWSSLLWNLIVFERWLDKYII